MDDDLNFAQATLAEGSGDNEEYLQRTQDEGTFSQWGSGFAQLSKGSKSKSKGKAPAPVKAPVCAVKACSGALPTWDQASCSCVCNMPAK